jgi:hypothetical protein
MSFIPQDPLQKIAIAKEKKEVADAAFKKGELQTGSSIFFGDSAGIRLAYVILECILISDLNSFVELS